MGILVAQLYKINGPPHNCIIINYHKNEELMVIAPFLKHRLKQLYSLYDSFMV